MLDFDFLTPHFAGIQLAKSSHEDTANTHEALDHVALQVLRKLMPITDSYDPHGAFFVKLGITEKKSNNNATCNSGTWAATPLFVVLLVIETTDMVFAVDSIPAVLAITTDPFIAYTYR